MQISPYSFIVALIGLCLFPYVLLSQDKYFAKETQLLVLVHIRIQVHHKLYILSAFSLIYSYIFYLRRYRNHPEYIWMIRIRNCVKTWSAM